MKNPLVSILCITYNHEQFIGKCLESLVSQECDFDFEILIHDDASTDETQAVIKEFQQRYPEVVKPIFQTENQWSKQAGGINLRFNYPRAKGKYIALCEGDDFWIGTDKLQKQVAILEEHPECSLTTGAYRMIRDGKEDVVIRNRLKTEEQDGQGGFFVLEDITNNFAIKTSTLVFRNLPDLIDQFKRYKFTFDMHLFYLLLKEGRGYYSNDVLAGYNQHKGGVYSGSAPQEILLTQYLILKDIYEKDADAFVRKKYLELTFLMINLKISGLMPRRKIKQKVIRNQNPNIVNLIKTIKPVLETKTERQTFYKSFIPMQIKVVRQKLNNAFS